MNIKANIEYANINVEDMAVKKQTANKALDNLWSGKIPYTGWVQAPLKQDKVEMDYILNVADIVKTEANLMVVIGTGDSYVGTKAAIDAVPNEEDGIEVRFAGINFSSSYLKQLMDDMSRRETVLCVISGKEEAPEVRAAFEILKELMAKKYEGKEAVGRRIITITDKESGALREETEKEGYVNFEMPEDIGEKYPAITPAGLFPMAVAGVDIRALIEGQRAAATSPDWDKNATDYAIARQLMFEQGKQIEAIEVYDSTLSGLGQWMKQLYGESEGKGGKGLLPVPLNFSTDLQGMDVFLKENNQNLFETVINVEQYDEEIMIPGGELKGKTLEDLNRETMQTVMREHTQAGIPIIEINVPKLDAYHYGQLIYFLQTTCSITAMLRELQ